MPLRWHHVLDFVHEAREQTGHLYGMLAASPHSHPHAEEVFWGRPMLVHS